MTKIYPFSHYPSLPEHQSEQRPIMRLIKENMNHAVFQEDAAFDWLYPEQFQQMSQQQWTPLSIARKAARFLAQPDARVLDIGSGIGKFCLTAAYYYPDTFFYGVEQRLELIHCAENAGDFMQLPNANFIHANITQINFAEFDHFYFYNSFYENIDRANRIDNTIEVSLSLYTYYTQYLNTMLDDKPSGTRVVTYQSRGEEIPPGYMLAQVSYDTLLKMWIKE